MALQGIVGELLVEIAQRSDGVARGGHLGFERLVAGAIALVGVDDLQLQPPLLLGGVAGAIGRLRDGLVEALVKAHARLPGVR
jgi:hypothetical protein